MKIPSDTIGNRTRDLPSCSAVLQLCHNVPPEKFLQCRRRDLWPTHLSKMQHNWHRGPERRSFETYKYGAD